MQPPTWRSSKLRRASFAAESAERGYYVVHVSKVTAQLTVELSDPVQSGLQILAEPSCFSLRAFQALLQAAFQSLLSGQAKQAALDYPDLEHIDPAILKYCHTAATTYIIEAGKQKADKSIIRYIRIPWKSCWEGRCPLHVTDVYWRLEYQIKTNQLHKKYCPAYLMTLRVENIDSRSHEDINFSCSMDQLQDLVEKLKDAAKSLERKTQL